MQNTTKTLTLTQSELKEWLAPDSLEYLASCLISPDCNYDSLLELRKCCPAIALKRAIMLPVVSKEQRAKITEWVKKQNEEMEF